MGPRAETCRLVAVGLRTARLLLETTVLIDALRGRSAADRIARLRRRLPRRHRVRTVAYPARPQRDPRRRALIALCREAVVRFQRRGLDE